MAVYIEVLSGHLSGARGVMVNSHGERVIDCDNVKSKWIVFKDGVEHSSRLNLNAAYRVIVKYESIRGGKGGGLTVTKDC